MIDWVYFTYDIVSSDMRAEVCHIFEKFKIMLVLENEDTSQTN